MQSDDDATSTLTAASQCGRRDRDRIAAAALREATAAKDNAEAIPPDGDLKP